MPRIAWSRDGEHISGSRRMLSRLIRLHCLPLKMRGTHSWLMGSLASAPEASEQSAILLKLTWRQVRELDSHKRACAMFNFSGSASLDQQLIDFTGEYLRDLATGAFLDFQWISIGLKS